jgi:hypothetical protein
LTTTISESLAPADVKADGALVITDEDRQLASFPYMKGDLLKLMYQGQRETMAKLHDIEDSNGSPVIFEEEEGDLNSRKVQARLHELYGYLSRELAEAMQELKLKPWKRTEVQTNTKAFVEEMADSFHFFLEMCITAGISPMDLYEAYFRMHKKNIDRQNNGY